MPCGQADFFFLSVPLLLQHKNFKVIKQSINKTKLLFIDRLGEKAINLAKVFAQDVLAHSLAYSTAMK